MRTSAIATACVLATVVLTGLGAKVASVRSAESGCAAVAEQRGHTSIGYSWSWTRLGTTCTFDGGRSETRLFW